MNIEEELKEDLAQCVKALGEQGAVDFEKTWTVMMNNPDVKRLDFLKNTIKPLYINAYTDGGVFAMTGLAEALQKAFRP